MPFNGRFSFLFIVKKTEMDFFDLLPLNKQRKEQNRSIDATPTMTSFDINGYLDDAYPINATI